jgi:microsomal dipeptidase-like Zn-dependent dipeptidase
MFRRWIGCIILVSALSTRAEAKKTFYEGFESGAKPQPNFFVSGNGQWNLSPKLTLPPLVPGSSTVWGWMPTFGENVSIARHDKFGESIPGMLMNDTDPTDGVQNTSGGLVKLGSVLGGDYWDSAYPVGVVGEYFLGTGDVRPRRQDPWNVFQPKGGVITKDTADEPLTFDAWTNAIPFNINSQDYRFVSFLIGGRPGNTDLPVYISVEMEPTIVGGSATGCSGKYLAPLPVGSGGVAIYEGEKGTFKSISDKISHNAADQANATSIVQPVADERMRLMVIDLWGTTYGPKGVNPRSGWCGNGRIRIVDLNPRAHLNADEILVSDLTEIADRYPSAPFGTVSVDHPAPIYGFAELHSHWMAHMGNGAQPLTTVTAPASRQSLRGLMTAMGTIGGAPYQASDTRIYDMCGGAQLGPSNVISAFCPAVGPTGQGGAGTLAQSCNPTTGACVLNAVEREQLALAACDGEYHAARATYDGDDFTDGDTDFFADTYYRPQEASATLLQGLAPNDGNAHTRHVLGQATQDAYHGVTGFDAADGRFVYPARPFMGKIHQQMYWTWLKRAWRGGLRILVTDVIHSTPLDLLLNEWWVIPVGHFGPLSSNLVYGHASDEQLGIQRQTCAVKKLVGTAPELSSWAQVVYDPAQARAAIARGKLAIVLGAEIDSAGALRAGIGAADPVAAELDFMQALGVRKLTPIHQVDNRVGGPAVFNAILTLYNDTLNLANDSLESGNCVSAVNWDRKFNPIDSPTHWNMNQLLFSDSAPASSPDSWISNFAPDNWAHLGKGQIDCTLAYSQYKLSPTSDWCTTDNPACSPDFHYYDLDFNPAADVSPNEVTFSMPSSWASLGSVDATDSMPFVRPQVEYKTALGISVIGRLHGFIADFGEAPIFPSSGSERYPNFLGQPSINHHGLTDLGQSYIGGLMAHGLLLDAEHMGEHSRDDGVFALVWGKGRDGFPCNDKANGLSVEQRHALADCQVNAYPVIATHSQLRWPQPSILGSKDERSWRSDEVTEIMQTGGLVGLNTGYDNITTAGMPLEAGHDLGKHNDCNGSSKSFAQHYLSYVELGEKAAAAGSPVIYDYGASGHGVSRPVQWASAGAAVGSDFNGVAAHVGSRFNGLPQNNCASTMAFDPAGDPMQLVGNSLQQAAADGVFYGTVDNVTWSSVNVGTGLFPQPALESLSAANGTPIFLEPVNADNEPDGGGFKLSFYDYNLMGLAHIGLLPDMLQDSVNPMRSDLGTFTDMQYQMRYLWRSAEDFIAAWEKSIAVCVASGSTTCTVPPPSDAATCDLWASDLDTGGQMFDHTSKAGQPNAEANQPSCMARCGQELTYTEWSLDSQSQLVSHQASCRCWVHPEDGDPSGPESSSPPANLCDDFKQWCQYAYNYSPDEGYLDWSTP